MCRLIAYLGAATPPASLVFGGSHSLYRQSWAPKEMLSGSVNADGYGIVWYAGGRPVRIAEARPIWYDGGLRSTLEAMSSTCVVAALRNGTPGLPVDGASLLPMVHERWSFVLNGFVPDFRRDHMRALRADLPDDLYAELGGVSDAETLFLLCVAHLREGATLLEALRRVRDRVADRVGSAEAQLNMLLADGERIAAIRESTVEATNSLYLAERPSVAPEGIVLASEAPDESARWVPVEPHAAVEIGPDGAREVR